MSAGSEKYKFSTHLDDLIRIFYVLALSSGVVTALMLWRDRRYCDSKCMIIVLSLATFMLGISDWFNRYLSMRENPYRRVNRVICDIILPTTLYLCFAFSYSLRTYVVLNIFYYSVVIIYYRLSIVTGPVPKGSGIASTCAFIFSIAAFAIIWIPQFGPGELWATCLIVLTAASVLIVALYYADKELRLEARNANM